MPDGDEHQSFWDEIRNQVWPAIEELRRFRVRFLLGLLGVAVLAGIAWGVETNRVSNHIGQDGIHITMTHATATAERLTNMEQSIRANTTKIEALEDAVNKQREADAANTKAILDAIHRRNGKEGGTR